MKLPSRIGVIHLPPLLGAPGTDSHYSAEDILQIAGHRAIEEARALSSAGFDGLMIENFGDAPFYKDQVPPETVASMAVILSALKEVGNFAIGVNVLRNDARSALALAAVTGAQMIRVNILSGVAATDQGFVEGKAAELLRERARLKAQCKILADVQVKHAVTLSFQGLGLAIEEAVGRGMADGVILTGEATGRPVSVGLLKEARPIAKRLGVPLYIGSGVDSENFKELAALSDGMLIGSAFRKQGRAGAPIDPKRLKALTSLFSKSRAKLKKR